MYFLLFKKKLVPSNDQTQGIDTMVPSFYKFLYCHTKYFFMLGAH
jgi:hypothetical protein